MTLDLVATAAFGLEAVVVRELDGARLRSPRHPTWSHRVFRRYVGRLSVEFVVT